MTTFLYRKSTNGNYFPIIDLTLHYKKNLLKTSALIDSGAAVSIFREEVADELRIKIEAGEEIYLNGVGGRIKGYVHRLKLEVAGKTFSCPIVFSREYLVSFNLLGRAAFFPKFKITFEEKNQQVALN